MPAYFIVDNEVTDHAGFEEYRKKVPSTVEKYGGKFLVRGGQVHTLEGDWKPKRIVVKPSCFLHSVATTSSLIAFSESAFGTLRDAEIAEFGYSVP